jgi:arylsulfatase A-like enzyme
LANELSEVRVVTSLGPIDFAGGTVVHERSSRAMVATVSIAFRGIHQSFTTENAMHAPHHVPKEWADKYKGQFDGGWDVYREQALARQKQMGLVPANTTPDAMRRPRRLLRSQRRHAHKIGRTNGSVVGLANTAIGNPTSAPAMLRPPSSEIAISIKPVCDSR